MSVARAREFVRRCRAAGLTVHEIAGCYERGNGQSSAYQGWDNHHTASPFANHTIDVLINGRRDLSGPLCNTAGYANGDIALVSAHPANHAGASGGWDTAPLPTTTVFNKLVWGHEVIYPGTERMTQAQYDSMVIATKIGIDIWGYGDLRRAKFHEGTSITGKWDPGYAPGKTYSISQFRDIASKTPIGRGGAAPGRGDEPMKIEDFTPEVIQKLKEINYQSTWWGAPGQGLIGNRRPGVPPAWPETYLGSMEQRIGAIMQGQLAGLAESLRQDGAGEARDLDAIAEASERGTRAALEGQDLVDETELARELAPTLAEMLPRIPDDQMVELVQQIPVETRRLLGEALNAEGQSA